MRYADRLLIGAALFAALTVGVKLTMTPRLVDTDRDRLARLIAMRLERAGYSVTRTDTLAPFRLRAARDGCRLAVQQVDAGAFDNSSFARRTRTIGPVNFHYRGHVSTSFPRVRPILLDQLQRQAARMGLNFSIDPIIAVATSPTCADPAPLLAKLRIHPRAGPPAIHNAPPD